MNPISNGLENSKVCIFIIIDFPEILLKILLHVQIMPLIIINLSGNVFINAPHLWNELRNMMLISTLFIVYLILLGPYLVRGKFDQIRQVKIEIL